MVTVGSGKECLDLVVQGRPEVLVLDLAIKKPDGWTVLEMLRQQRVESSILVVTGDRKSGRRSGQSQRPQDSAPVGYRPHRRTGRRKR